jgi:hypothetical protein
MRKTSKYRKNLRAIPLTKSLKIRLTMTRSPLLGLGIETAAEAPEVVTETEIEIDPALGIEDLVKEHKLRVSLPPVRNRQREPVNPGPRRSLMILWPLLPLVDLLTIL